MSADAADFAAPMQRAGGRERRETLELCGWVGLVALAPAAVVYLSFNAGGYFPSATGLVAVVLAQALVLRTTLAARPFEGFSRALAVPLAALALYAAWQLTSATWSHDTARTLDSFDRTLLYLLALVLFGSVRLTRERLRWTIRALVLGLFAVCVSGLVSRVLPHLWPTAAGFYDDRLNFPLTYWNAEGMIAALALILGFHLTCDRAERWCVRVLAAAALPGVAATLLLTFSRGALGVSAVGLLVYCVLTRLHTLPGALLAVVAPTVIAVRSAWDATLLATAHATSHGAVAQGRHVAIVVGGCMLGAGTLRGAMVLPERWVAHLTLVRTPPRRAIRLGAGAVITTMLLTFAVSLGGAGFVHRQYERFANSNSDAHAIHTRERLSDASNNGRVSLWSAALSIYWTQQLHGTGAGTYQLQYPLHRTEGLYVADAHSLYLQSLAELGVVGLALILVAVIGILGGLAARIRGPDRALYAALFAATLAWSIHQAFDWDWQMPAVTLGVFILTGVALARPRDGGVRLSGLPAGRTLVALGWLVLAVAPFLASTSYARLHSSAQQLRQGDCVAARRDAMSSLSLSARRPQAYVILGVCDLKQGFAQAAVPAMAEAATLEPQSWEGQFWLAVARAAAGIDPRAAISRAVALNPLEAGLRSAVRRLRSGGPREWERASNRLRVEALTSGKFATGSL
jgi:O-antigen ligase